MTTQATKGHSSIQAAPTRAWEASTWSTRNAASIHDVDTDKHRKTIAIEERPPNVITAA